MTTMEKKKKKTTKDLSFEHIFFVCNFNDRFLGDLRTFQIRENEQKIY